MNDFIKLEHGSGGALSRELVEKVIYPKIRNVCYPALVDGTDISCLETMCVTSDTYVIDPPFFPGGDIGRLCVFGTCNDLSVSGAAPQYLSLAFVLEEGFSISDLGRILDSIASAAGEAEVSIVTGDTKVVPSGKGGGIYINTTGIGYREYTGELGSACITEGDAVVISGPVGRHGMAILAAREKLPVGTALESDCAFLYPLCRSLFDLGDDLRFMRDATRGGVAAVLNEAVSDQAIGVLLKEADIPIDDDVASTANILGLNPLEIANEGVFIAVISADKADKAVELISAHEAGKDAKTIGHVVGEHSGAVMLETRIGGKRLLDLPRGLLLPRIC